MQCWSRSPNGEPSLIYVLTAKEGNEWRPVAVVDQAHFDVAEQWQQASKTNDWIPLELNDLSLTAHGNVPTSFKPLPISERSENTVKSLEEGHGQLISIIEQLAERYGDKDVLKVLKKLKAEGKIAADQSLSTLTFEIEEEHASNKNWSIKAWTPSRLRNPYSPQELPVGEIDLQHGDDDNVWVFDISVEDDWRRTGLGQSLYDQAIAEAKRRGYTKFDSSTDQSHDARKAWSRLTKRYPVAEQTLRNPWEKYYSIDLTKVASPNFSPQENLWQRTKQDHALACPWRKDYHQVCNCLMDKLRRSLAFPDGHYGCKECQGDSEQGHFKDCPRMRQEHMFASNLLRKAND